MQFVRLLGGLALVLLAPIIVICVAPVLFALAAVVMPLFLGEFLPWFLSFAKAHPLVIGAAFFLLVFRRVIWRPRKEEFERDEW